MNKQFFFLLTIIGLTSCEQSKTIKNAENKTDIIVDSADIINDPKNNLNIQTNSFSEIDSSGICMFPLSMGDADRESDGMIYKDMPATNFWNIIFLNTNTNEYHLLSDQKMLISSYNYNNYSDNNAEKTLAKKYIFYSIIVNDLNQDNKLTLEDPKYLFLSDKHGNSLRQISPSNYDLQNWQFIKSANKVIMTLKKDSDKDNKFDHNDETTSFEIDIDKDTEPRETFPLSFKNKLKIIYDRDWNKLKK
jgi:hypothetical protein